MLRLWTYLTLDGDGEPTAAGTWFDPPLAELDAEAARNIRVQAARTGMPIPLWDPTPQYPVSGTLLVGTTHVDLASGAAYGGDLCRLGPVLYDTNENHLPICLFSQNLNDSSQKCYVAYIIRMDTVLEAQATDNIHDRMHLSRIRMGRVFRFGLVITQSGEFSDLDDVASGSWVERFPPAGTS